MQESNEPLTRLKRLISIVKADMRKAGVPFDDDASFRIKKGIKAYGQCNIRYSVKYQGFRSDIYIAEHTFNEDDLFLKDVICHELIHSAPACYRCGHRGAWQRFAKQMNTQNPNYYITATVKPTEEDIEMAMRNRQAKAHYRVQCNTCGTQVYYLKKGQVVKLLEQQENLSHCSDIACTVCGGKSFKLEYLKKKHRKEKCI